MIRLRNTTTGAVVVVRDEKADRMGSEWQPVEVEQAPEPAPARGRKPRAKSE